MDVADLADDPVLQFRRWKEAYSPNEDAVCLATASPEGVPNARMVLVKGAPETGFVFYTNRDSAKGRELAGNPRATLVFHWNPRSIRVSGRVEPITDTESDAYWASRPRGSQLGAWASSQSTVIEDRSMLEDRLTAVMSRFEGDAVVPRPSYWGGFRVVPTWIEFWQHRDDRLHDRIRYRAGEGGAWVLERLSP